MAKYYVQSGSLRGIVDCFDEQCAAVWTIQRVMDKATAKTQRAGSSSEQDFLDAVSDFMFELDDTIEINEQGFGRNDSTTIDVHDAFLYWYRLEKAIRTLSQALDEKLGD